MANQASIDTWNRATLALALLAIDPALGGICVRARSGPVRSALRLPDGVRLHPAMGDDALYGGLDLTATLSSGQAVARDGLLDRGLPLILSMAERCPVGLAARIALHLDATAVPLIALDEGAEDDEVPSATLTERLAFYADLSDVAMADAVSAVRDIPTSHTVAVTPEQVEQIVTVAASCGIDSLRAPTFTLRAAKAHAVLMGRDTLAEDDITTACALTLAHRATRIPEDAPEEEPEQDAPPPDDTPQNQDKDDTDTPEDNLDLPDELLFEAIRALIPDDLLARLAAQKARTGRGNGTGAARRGNRRGRPLPSRAGRLQDGARIDIVATLRTAAPWQTIRRQDTGRDGLHIRSSDIRLRRFEEKSDRLLIFTVDASGSAALARLAEAKGAVEILLAQAYARRDYVALVSFRGTGADMLLPPTRSLVQTKRRLAELPGGGGTPLALGLDAALELAMQSGRRGMTPTVCLLTDGRANIARDGSANRGQAASDAETSARIMRAQGVDALVIDTGNRPSAQLRDLSNLLAAPYLALPRADAKRLSTAVAAALDD